MSSTTKPRLIVGIGELLWDLLPAGQQLGGAPANFAVMSARLGNHAVIASRLGVDPLGEEARRLLATLPADATQIQNDIEHPTGTVSVDIVGGQPEYVIHQPVAWDFLAFTPEWRELASRADAVCFGSLAQRSKTSCDTIHAFLAATFPECVRVFDVNLRKPFYSAEVLERSLQSATILKLNDAEVPEVVGLLGLGSYPRHPHNTEPDQAQLLEAAHNLLSSFPLQLICITLGGYGSLLVSRDGFDRHHGFPTKVADTVGAGDAFTAAMVSAYLQQAPLRVLNEAGNRWGSWVASQKGAMPVLPDAVRESIAAEVRRVARDASSGPV